MAQESWVSSGLTLRSGSDPSHVRGHGPKECGDDRPVHDLAQNVLRDSDENSSLRSAIDGCYQGKRLFQTGVTGGGPKGSPRKDSEYAPAPATHGLFSIVKKALALWLLPC